MAENIPNADDYNEMKQSMEDMNAQMKSFTSQMLFSQTMMLKMVKNEGDFTKALEDATGEFDNMTKSMEEATAATKAAAKAQKEQERVNANFKLAKEELITGLKQFAGAMLSTEQSMSKYGSSVNSLGNAAQTLGKNFGLVGASIGLSLIHI